MKKQVEMSIQDGNGNEFVAYPKTHKEHVQFENGMNIDEFVGQDIATPTITHDTTAIKVGVGDSDVSSSVVDSTVNMTIKGQTYQNILPDPTLRNEMQGKSMQRLNEGYDSIETVDGVSKSAILKGQTLVNIENTLFPKTTGWYDNNGVNSFYRNAEIISMMNPNTDYLLYVEALPTVSQFLSVSGGLFGAKAVNLTNGKAIAKVTTTDVLPSQATNYFKSSVGGNLTQEEKESIKLMIIKYQDGMENWDIPYFTGMQSVKMPVLKTVGKNLFPPLTEYDSITQNVTGEEYELTERKIVWNSEKIYTPSIGYYFNLKPNTKYTFSCSKEGNPEVIIFDRHSIDWDSNHSICAMSTIETTVGKRKVCNFTTRSDGKVCIRLSNSRGYTVGCWIEDCSLTEFDNNNTHVYEPYKTNILHTPEDVVLKGIGDVQDTLDCNTGEYVQRIGEYQITGDEDWRIDINNERLQIQNPQFLPNIKYGVFACDKLEAKQGNDPSLHGCNGTYYIGFTSDNWLRVFLEGEITSLEQAKEWLKENKPIIQYNLATPIIKTVDLSSSGNWEKAVLDGSEDEAWIRSTTNNNYFVECNLPNRLQGMENNGWVNTLPMSQVYTSNTNIGACMVKSGGLRIRTKEILNGQSLEEWKQYLQQNPITVWYQIQTQQDPTQVKQPIFFKDGHIIQSSGADNSLIPTLDYQAKTKNSYVMDLMKPNTQYTMKAKTVSGTFTIDGTSYNVNANGTFTSPSSMTDKLLIMSNKTNEEVMIIGGDVTSKTIPYFKGIKSAFEGEDKIEVLSTGKNLFDMNRRYDNITNAQATVVQNVDKITVSSVEDGTYVNANFVLDKNFFKGKTVVGGCLYESDEKGIGTVQINYQDTTGKKYCQSIKTSRTFTFPDEFVGEVLLCVYANNTNTPQSNTVTVRNIQLELGTKSTTYNSHKSNTTKIPLLSPLRSFPHGVYDEIILDREKNKAQIIQRIDCVVLNGDEEWSAYPTMEQERTLLFQTMNTIVDGKNAYCMCDSHPYNNSLWSGYYEEGIQLGGSKEKLYKHIDVRLSKLKVSSNDKVKVRDYFRENPTTVLYELQTPIITEVDLEGFPYIYKDGHIFLNSDIAPTTEITYSINQAQQIESANENLQRHEKEISHLQKLIAQYIQVEYESTLLSLKI